jgi:hypothetical protein
VSNARPRSEAPGPPCFLATPTIMAATYWVQAHDSLPLVAPLCPDGVHCVCQQPRHIGWCRVTLNGIICVCQQPGHPTRHHLTSSCVNIVWLGHDVSHPTHSLARTGVISCLASRLVQMSKVRIPLDPLRYGEMWVIALDLQFSCTVHRQTWYVHLSSLHRARPG